MDAVVVLGSFFLLLAIGTPVAYTLGVVSVIGALWIGLPLDAVIHNANPSFFLVSWCFADEWTDASAVNIEFISL